MCIGHGQLKKKKSRYSNQSCVALKDQLFNPSKAKKPLLLIEIYCKVGFMNLEFFARPSLCTKPLIFYQTKLGTHKTE